MRDAKRSQTMLSRNDYRNLQDTATSCQVMSDRCIKLVFGEDYSQHHYSEMNEDTKQIYEEINALSAACEHLKELLNDKL